MIEIKGLGKQFQNETEIDYRDITFESGKSYMLLGASGCGKSTLLNMIAGILSPTKGAIVFNNRFVLMIHRLYVRRIFSKIFSYKRSSGSKNGCPILCVSCSK